MADKYRTTAKSGIDAAARAAEQQSGGTQANYIGSGNPFTIAGKLGALLGEAATDTNTDNPPVYYGGGYSSGPTDAQKDAAANLKPIALYGQDTITGKADQMNKVYDIADQGNKAITAFQAKQAEKNKGAEWFSNRLKEQSTYESLRNALQQGAYGGTLLGLNSAMQRANDAHAVSVLEALEADLADIDVDEMSALQANINARNELAANTEASLRANYGDYVAQTNNIHPDLAEDMIDTENNKLNSDEDFLEAWYNDHTYDAVSPNYVSNRIRPERATELAIRMPNENMREQINALDAITTPRAAKETAGYQKQALFDQYDSMMQRLGTNNSSAANKKYWDTLTRDYGHRMV